MNKRCQNNSSLLKMVFHLFYNIVYYILSKEINIIWSQNGIIWI